jgi:hypothetical protein
MEFQHVNLKIFVEGELPFDPSRLINVFHHWIQDSALPELLIDVADYGHVPNGPGIMLIAHEADYSMDHTDGRWGLRYNRKAALPGGNEDRFRQAFSAASIACRKLEEAFATEGPLKFSRTQFEVCINDRALAPNNPETAAAFESDLRVSLKNILGHEAFTLQTHPDRRRRVGAVVTTSKPFVVP